MMVMEELQLAQSPFQLQLEALYLVAEKDHVLEKFRAKAWESFLKKGLPSKKDELFRYIKLSNLYLQEYASASSTADEIDIAPYLYPETAQSTLVFVNGEFRPALSRTQALPQKMVILPLPAAMQSYGALLSNQLSKACRDEADPFALLNLALQPEGLFIYLPPRTNCLSPIQLLNIVDGRVAKALTFPRVQLFVGSSASLEIISTHASLNAASQCIDQVTEAYIEENARLRYVQVNNHAIASTWHFDALRATLKKDSFLEATLLTGGGATVRNDYRVVLTGTNGEALLNGLSLLTDKREAHCHILVDHQAPQCSSRQLYKNILDKHAHVSFEGKILVHKEAQKTNAFQLNNNLLLSDYANAESKPNLEIFADDVKASHGATMGQLDKEELFYLQSRGFSPHAAKNLLIYGFCQEVIDKIPLASLRGNISALARDYARG